MGAWETGSYQNDTGLDVKDDYIQYLRKGLDDEQAFGTVWRLYENQLHDDEMYDVVFALADTMWKKGRLIDELKKYVFELILQEEKSGRWEGEKIQKARKKELEKLKVRLSSEMPPRN